jgi:hypothetical protein
VPGVRLANHDFWYEAIGHCILQTLSFTVLDIGVRTYRYEGEWNRESRFQLGKKYRTEDTLGVDGFSNFSCLKANGDEMPLVHTWRIESIRQLEPKGHGSREVTSTDRQGDDSYLLICELLPVEPKSSSTTALR